MADFIDFRYGTYAEINSASKNTEDFYFATDKPLFYANGQWIGIASLTSSVNASTGAITLTINANNGTKIEHTISGAGMTTEQKEQLATAFNFVTSITGTDSDDVINKWNDIISFLSGIEDTETLSGLLNDISTEIAKKADKATTITAGNGLTGGGDLSANRTITLGTPSTITDSSTNSVTETTHTHAIDEASTSKRGIVQLNDSLSSTSTAQALTANQGKVLDGKITAEATARQQADTKHTADIKSITDLFNLLFTPHYASDGSLESIEANAGFWSNEYISTKGEDDTASGDGGVDLTAVWETLKNNSDAFANELINIAHIPDLTTAKITDFTDSVKALLTSANMPTITTAKISDFATQVNSLISSWSASRKVNAGTGLTGGGALSSDVTLSLATVGKAGTYYKVTVDAYGRVTSGNTSLALSDVTNLETTLTNVATTVSNHETRITAVEGRLKWKSLTED